MTIRGTTIGGEEILKIIMTKRRKEKKLMISERTLKQWRKLSLLAKYNVDSAENPYPDTIVSLHHIEELNKRICMLTQDLMDVYLLRKG